MEARTSIAKRSFSNSKVQLEIKRFKGESSGCQVGSGNEKYSRNVGGSGNSFNIAASAALDNHLILQEIFKFFSPGDLRIFCEVNEKWRAVAGPMIFDYHFRVETHWTRTRTDVVITKGYFNPQIEKRNFSSKAETEYLETLQCGNCFIHLELNVRYLRHREIFETIEFVKKFRTRVYKISCYSNGNLREFFNQKPSTQDFHMLPYFPHCEEYCVSSLCPTDWFTEMKIPRRLNHLRRVYLGKFSPNDKWKYSSTNAPTFLPMIRNLKEVYEVPFIMISQFQKVKKVHLIRSVRFHAGVEREVQTEAMKTMVQAGMKFKFLRIGVNNAPKKGLVERNMKHFEDLLDIGKDTLEHLVIHSKTTKNTINFPATMSALRHITLKKISNAPVNFPTDFNFSSHFPKLTTISFSPITLAEWKSGLSWWGSNEKPEFSKGIRRLRCTRGLSYTVEQKLLERFPSVNQIDYVDNIDETDVDGIVF